MFLGKVTTNNTNNTNNTNSTKESSRRARTKEDDAMFLGAKAHF